MEAAAADEDGRAEEDVMEEDEDTQEEDYVFSYRDEDYGFQQFFCEQSWLQIKHNDPKLTAVKVIWGSSLVSSVNWETESHYLGTNTAVKDMNIFGVNVDEEYETDGRKQIIDFCKGLACNKSIKRLTLHQGKFLVGSMFAYLWPFFENNCNLKCVQIVSCTMSGESAFMLASALSRCRKIGSSLEEVTIRDNLIRDETALAKLISAFKDHGNITKLSLASNKFRRGGLEIVGCAALIQLIQNPACNIRLLDLRNSNINDNGIGALSQLLLNKNSLRRLCLGINDGVTTEGWESFFGSLQSPNSTLQQLDLEGNSIDDRGAAALATALENNTSLRLLDLGMNENITNLGWRSLFSALSNPRSALRELNISSINIDDEGLSALANGLENNTTMRTLNLSYFLEVTSRGWIVFFNSLQNSNSVLKRMDLSENSMDNDAAAAMSVLLGRMSSLKTLNLSYNHDISIEGWASILTIIRSPNCNLRKLYLERISLNDEAVHVFANVLIHNRSLRVLLLNSDLLDSEETTGETIITTGWAAISNALCDKSSINAIYSSNHILQKLFEDDFDDLPEDISFLLQLNKNNTRAGAMRQKVLHYHFLNDGIHVEELIGMDLKILPIAISWIGKDNVGLPVLHRLFQTMPTLFDSNMRVNNRGLKRKLV